MVEHPKSNSTQPSPKPDAPDCICRLRDVKVERDLSNSNLQYYNSRSKIQLDHPVCCTELCILVGKELQEPGARVRLDAAIAAEAGFAQFLTQKSTLLSTCLQPGIEHLMLVHQDGTNALVPSFPHFRDLEIVVKVHDGIFKAFHSLEDDIGGLHE